MTPKANAGHLALGAISSFNLMFERLPGTLHCPCGVQLALGAPAITVYEVVHAHERFAFALRFERGRGDACAYWSDCK